MRTASSRARLAMVALILWSQISPLPIGVMRAMAQAGKPPVQQGQEYYEQSRFDDAIALLRDLVDRGQLKGEDLQKARELLARSYVKKGYPTQGKDTFKAILKDNPAYRPDPIRVPPDETVVFDEALKEYESEKAAGAVPPATGAVPGAAAGATAGKAAKGGGPSMAPSGSVVPATSTVKKPLTSQWWFWALGAAAVGGIAVAAGGGGGDDGGGLEPLPGFPSPPQ